MENPPPPAKAGATALVAGQHSMPTPPSAVGLAKWVEDKWPFVNEQRLNVGCKSNVATCR